jgi:hypothetical protein
MEGQLSNTNDRPKIGFKVKMEQIYCTNFFKTAFLLYSCDGDIVKKKLFCKKTGTTESFW